MAVRTEDRDLGRNRLLKEISKLKRKPFVKIGFQAATGSEAKTSLDSSGTSGTPDRFVTVLEIALVHEFGSSNGVIPERSFLRSTHDEKKRERFRITRKLIDGIMVGRMTVDRALGIMGIKGVADVKKRIQSGIDPALKPSTIRSKTVRGKAGTTPLIDTGQMINSITFIKVIP